MPVQAFNPGGTSLTYSATNLPSGLSIVPSTGIITGTIAAGAASAGDDGQGDYLVTVTVTDGTYSGTTETEWSVSPRLVVQLADEEFIEGDSVRVPVQGVTPDGTSLSYTATGLPAGLSLNSSTGDITGT